MSESIAVGRKSGGGGGGGGLFARPSLCFCIALHHKPIDKGGAGGGGGGR